MARSFLTMNVLGTFLNLMKYYDIDKDIFSRGCIKELSSGSRRRFVSEARRIIAYRLVKDYGIPLSEIARRVGVSTSPVSKMISRVAN